MTISIKIDSEVIMGTKIKSSKIIYNDKYYDCPISMAMDLIGGKWKSVILHYLKNSEKRFNELRKDIPAITEMTLSLQLKQLEKDRLITRQVFGEKPPIKVIYALSPLGHQVCPALAELCSWALTIAQRNDEDISNSTAQNIR